MGKELGSILQLEVLCEGLAEQPVDGCRVGSIAHFLQPLLLCIFRHCCKRVLTHVDCHSHTSTARWGKMFSHQCKEEERQGRGQSLRERESKREPERERERQGQGQAKGEGESQRDSNNERTKGKSQTRQRKNATKMQKQKMQVRTCTWQTHSTCRES